MSYYYDEEWERKKSYLIKSLFCDIPYRGLSPVPEEGTLTSSEEYQESSGSSALIPSEELSSDTAPPSTKIQKSAILSSAIDNREPSPLPPLIIEREPNRHDEPKEYYEELLIKIRRIYRKMFIENKDLDEDDFRSEIEQDVITSETNDFDYVRTNSSDGYNADYESITDDDNSDDDDGNDDNDQDLVPNEDTEFVLNEDEINENLNNNKISVNYLDIDDEPNSSNGDADYMQVTIQAVVHVDGLPPASVQPSPIYGEPHVESNSHLNTIFPQIQANLNTISYSNKPLNLFNEEKPFEPARFVSHVSEDRQCDELAAVDREYAKSPILMSSRYDQRVQYVQVHRQENRDGYITEEEKKYVPDFNIAAPVHSENDCEALLRISTSNESTHVDKEDDVILEEEQGPETSSSAPTEEQRQSIASNHIEAMRTLRPQASIESVTIENTRINSDTDIASDRDSIVMRDISNMTSNSENCQHIPPKVSFDLNILTSIVNENNVNDCQNSVCSDKVNKNPRSRKRTNADIDIEIVNWNDLRDNFFVGVPKIFKLCSCQSHVCVET